VLGERELHPQPRQAQQHERHQCEDQVPEHVGFR
jgi:hypothetical protein